MILEFDIVLVLYIVIFLQIYKEVIGIVVVYGMIMFIILNNKWGY